MIEPRHVDPQHMVGKHSTYFQEPDIIFMKLVGEVKLEEGRELLDRQLAMSQGFERMFLLMDLAELENIVPDLRKEVARRMSDVPLHGTVGYDAPLKAKVLAKLVAMAINLFVPDARRNPILFRNTEEEARAWIDERRHELDGKGAD